MDKAKLEIREQPCSSQVGGCDERGSTVVLVAKQVRPCREGTVPHSAGLQPAAGQAKCGTLRVDWRALLGGNRERSRSSVKPFQGALELWYRESVLPNPGQVRRRAEGALPGRRRPLAPGDEARRGWT